MLQWTGKKFQGKKMTDKSSIVEVLNAQNIEIKSVSGNRITVLVDGNRLDVINKLTASMENLGAQYDKNVPGSSIGGIRIGSIVILVKAKGKTGGLDVESAAIRTLQEAMTTAMVASGGPINIKVGNKTVRGCVGVEKTAGTPKSDFHIVNENGKPVIFISHKKGSKPTDFQQWSGMTEEKIINHSETKSFIAHCQAIFGKKMPSGTSIYKKIVESNLKMMSVFGVDYGGSSGINNVDVLIQGDPGLEKLGGNDFWRLTATANIHYNGDLPQGGFDPVMTLIYKGDRSQFGIQGARASIYPIAGRRMISLEDYIKKKK